MTIGKRLISKIFTGLIACVFATDILAQGFDERYEAWKLTNGDIYIKQKPEIVLLHGDIITPIVLPAPVEEFVLLPQGQGYSTSSDTSGVNLSGAVQVDVSLGDFNVDGLLDIVLKDIGTNVFDQIVFADAAGIPQVVTTMDDDFQSFFEEVYQWMLNPNYFEENAPTSPEVQTTYTLEVFWNTNDYFLWLATEDYCADNYDLCGSFNANLGGELDDDWCAYVDLFYGIFCDGYTFWVWGYTEETTIVEVPDYSGFNQDALHYANSLAPILQRAKVILAESPAIKETLKNVFGAVLIELIFGEDALDYEDILGEVLNSEHVRVLEEIGVVIETACRVASSEEDCIERAQDLIEITIDSFPIPGMPDSDIDNLGILWPSILSAEAARRDDPQRVWCTYSKTRTDGRKYFGRTSGTDGCDNAVSKRDQAHKSSYRFPSGWGDAVPDKGSQGVGGYSAIRGREQQLIDERGGVAATYNLIRGVSAKNPNGCTYWLASNTLFLPWGPWTGDGNCPP